MLVVVVCRIIEQIAGAHPDQMMRCAELLSSEVTADFVDLNLGCPLDLICDQGERVTARQAGRTRSAGAQADELLGCMCCYGWQGWARA